MKIKTANLTDLALDWAVEQSLGGTWRPYIKYSTDWAHGGPIIEREGISINDTTMRGEGGNFAWCATRIESPGAVSEEYGLTPLIAAMRCYVASRLGDEVDIPKELSPRVLLAYSFGYHAGLNTGCDQNPYDGETHAHERAAYSDGYERGVSDYSDEIEREKGRDTPDAPRIEKDQTL